MPTLLHEALVELLKENPQVLAIVGLPASGWTPGPADLGDVLPTERRADAVLLHADLVAIIEVQLQIARWKKAVMAAYQASAHLQHRRTALVLVVTTSPRVARWAAEPYDLGGGSVFQAAVLDLSLLPVLEQPPDHATALLTALGHARQPDAERAARAALRALATVDTPQTTAYTSLILAVLPHVVRQTLEAAMLQLNVPEAEILRRARSEGRQEGRQEGREEGRAAGERALLTRLLTHRFGPLPEWASRRLALADTAQLDAWALALLDAASLDDVLGAP